MGKVKRVCDKCGKLKRSVTKCMKTSEYWCKSCKNKYGTNPFYVPPSERLSSSVKNIKVVDEDRALIREKMKEGLSYYAARKRVNRTRKFLVDRRRKKGLEKKEEIIKKEKSKQMNKKFLEGLK